MRRVVNSTMISSQSCNENEESREGTSENEPKGFNFVAKVRKATSKLPQEL